MKHESKSECTSKEELLKVIKDKHDQLEREDRVRRNPTAEQLAVKVGPSPSISERKEDRWISVDEREPECMESVLVANQGEEWIAIGCIYPDGNYRLDLVDFPELDTVHATHWQPLPSLPAKPKEQ